MAADRARTWREEKKERTSLALVEVAHRRFATDGYHETTLEDISTEVGVRVQTLLRHFESKAHLAMAPWYHRLGILVDRLHTRQVDALQVWREFVVEESAEAMSPSTTTASSVVGSIKAFRAWAERDPVLVAMSSDIEVRAQLALAHAIAADRSQAADDLHSRLLASMLVTGRSAVFERWVSSGARSERLIADQLRLIEVAVAAFPRRSTRALLPLGRVPPPKCE
ncbi:MAG: TetR/AcrR family transcriptional regulator [Acidimicrobiales bacterium]|nr:TetR/AcrR family transcriptional regulator [Acidimicrobiales bacterium]MCB9395344.1 TetR/AcrR family transcriptional regulator [Acidimicrobiaceae bacterium]